MMDNKYKEMNFVLHREIRFVDRVEEINALKEWCSHFRATPLYLYGPEGCGKTRLLKEFIITFDKFFGKDSIAIYIDAMERESIEKAILTSPSIKTSIEVIAPIVEKFTGLNIGEILANKISSILEKLITKKKLKDKNILVAIDDVTRAIGLDQIEWYVKWLYELLWKLAKEYKPKTINFIVTTSEGKSLDLVSKHRHAHILLLWNLNRNAFKQLFNQLNPPTDIEYEEIWKLLGGNPGKLIELATTFKWNIKNMKTWYKTRLEKTIRSIAQKGLLNKLKETANNITTLDNIHDTKAQKLADILTEENLIIYKKWITLTGKEIPQNTEIGIGKYYAWQVPMYGKLLKEITQNHISTTTR